MYKTKGMMTSSDTIATKIQREKIPATGAYDTVKSTTLIMDYNSANFREYRSY